jgi:chemotaxis protein MotA
MNTADLIDIPSALIVFGGTSLATMLNSGLRATGSTFRVIAGLWRKRFDADHVRADLAVQVQEIRARGIMRTEPHRVGDAEFDQVSDTLIGSRSIPALLAAHEEHKARRQALSDCAVRTLSQGAELAPVAGLAGTLLALSQLPPIGISGADYAGTIAMAVLTTLYGLVFANLVLAPLARTIARSAAAEEAQRQSVVDWLAEQVAEACAPRDPLHGRSAA